MKLEYYKEGEYFLTILELLDKTNENPNLGKYGIMRLNYLKENKKGLYTCLKMKNELYKHLMQIELDAQKRVENLIKEYMISESINENLKSENQLEWVKKMNSIKSRVEEIVIKELIFV